MNERMNEGSHPFQPMMNSRTSNHRGHSTSQRALTVGIRWVRLIDCDVIVGGGVLLVLCPAAADSPVSNELAIESPDGVLRRFSCPVSSKQDTEMQSKQAICEP